ncbi:MAG: hypothetical protein Q9157_009171, partial [Trypethelium eluteriae]
MADQRPIPQPPRTPTPPPEDGVQKSAGLEAQAAELGFSVIPEHSVAPTRDPNTLSPTSAEFPSGGSNGSTRPSPTMTDYGLYSPMAPPAEGQLSTGGLSPGGGVKSPFNFTPVQYSAGGRSAGSIGKS